MKDTDPNAILKKIEAQAHKLSVNMQAADAQAQKFIERIQLAQQQLTALQKERVQKGELPSKKSNAKNT